MSGIRNLDFIRQLASKDFPDLGAKLVETFSDLVRQISNHSQQTNSNPDGSALPPSPINGLNVTAQNGHFSVAIQDNGPIYRGINYWLEHADNPNFFNPQVIDLGQTRNHTVFLGNATRYFRAYSSYTGSPPSSPVYFGGPSPQGVQGGGSVGPPAFQPSQGSGTGPAGAGLQGPGIAPFRSLTGVPPLRGTVVAKAGGGGVAQPPLLSPGSAGVPSGLIMSGTSGTSPYKVIEDTHAHRLANYPAANYGVGQLFYETDRTVWYLITGVPGSQNWTYVGGIFTNSNGNIPGDLGANDAGFLFGNSTYEHTHYWTGAAWQFAPGDAGSRYIVSSSAVPLGGAWALCNGGAVAVSNADGTTTNVTTPNLTGDVFLKGGTPGAQQAATTPTWAGGAKTDSGTTGISVAAHSQASTFATGGAATADTTAGHSVTDPGHQHGLSNANATLNAPSEANGGLPLRIALSWYMRQ